MRDLETMDLTMGHQDMRAETPHLRSSPSYSSLGSPSFVSPADTFTTELDDSDFREFRASSLQFKPIVQSDVKKSFSTADVANQPSSALAAVVDGSARQSVEPLELPNLSTGAPTDDGVREVLQQLVPEALDPQAGPIPTEQLSSGTASQCNVEELYQNDTANPRSLGSNHGTRSDSWQALEVARGFVDADGDLPHDVSSGDLPGMMNTRGTKRKQCFVDHAELVRREGQEPFPARTGNSKGENYERGGLQRGAARREDREVRATGRNESLPSYHQERPERQVAGSASNSRSAAHANHGVHHGESHPPAHPPVSDRRRRGIPAAIHNVQETLPYRAHPSVTADELVTSQTLRAATPSSHKHSDTCKFRCDQCGREFPKKSGHDEHKKQVHSNKRPYVCSKPDCRKDFKTPSLLTRHMRIHNPKDQVYCLGCDHAGFAQLGALRQHLTIRPTSEQCIKDWLELGEELDRLAEMLKRDIGEIWQQYRV